jgi:geranylgeranyl pyrophosphate synthase
MTEFDLEGWAAPRRAQLQQYLDSLFQDAVPPSFGVMCRYPLQTGGKRMRPLLAMAAYEETSGSDGSELLIPLWASIELIHTYSLVHDDLPAMDDDDERRSQPTVHKLYGEAAAILVGDALLTEAFRQLHVCRMLDSDTRVALLHELSHASGYAGMIGGQALDLGLGGPVTDLETLVALHRRKTGALIQAAVRMGAIAGGGDEVQSRSLDKLGRDLGLAFQLADDVLDADQDAGEDGPPSFVKLIGVDATTRRARELADSALSALDVLEHPALEALARYTVDRRI